MLSVILCLLSLILAIVTVYHTYKTKRHLDETLKAVSSAVELGTCKLEEAKRLRDKLFARQIDIELDGVPNNVIPLNRDKR